FCWCLTVVLIGLGISNNGKPVLDLQVMQGRTVEEEFACFSPLGMVEGETRKLANKLKAIRAALGNVETLLVIVAMRIHPTAQEVAKEEGILLENIASKLPLYSSRSGGCKGRRDLVGALQPDQSAWRLGMNAKEELSWREAVATK
ncbi:MAG: hypothetical protein L0Y56_13250, partial [Nitrospira sp.]|nr:hypothetical protein [Nitrospira sp.]